MDNSKAVQLVFLALIAALSGAFIWFGVFSVFIWLWFALLIAAVLSFLRELGIKISFS